MECTGHITGGNNKDANRFADIFFDPMSDLDPDKKHVELHMFDGASVCRKAKKVLKVVYLMLSFIFGSEHTCHNVFKGWASVE